MEYVHGSEIVRVFYQILYEIMAEHEYNYREVRAVFRALIVKTRAKRVR